VAIRGVLQNAGYFKCLVDGDGFLVRATPTEYQYGLTLHIDAGTKYSLDEIRFANAQAGQPLIFPESELRESFAMEPGDLMDASRVRGGLQRLIALYGSRGYIDMTPEPEFDIDGESARMLIKIDEQKPYRIGQIEILGLTEKAQAALRKQLRTGDIFDAREIDLVIHQNRAFLPADASRRDVALRRNARAGLVDLTFDFRLCPGATRDAPQ
jgi:outer membrane protein assembly factor BamA